MRWAIVVVAGLFGACASTATDGERSRLERAVTEAIRPLMAEYDVPGMAVALTIQKRRYVFDYGVADDTNGQKVTEQTLFEIGSISKTFTATLVGYAQANGVLSLSDRVGQHLPELVGSSLGQVSLLDLGTYTAGGLPLQFPEDVDDHDKMIAYFVHWRPEHAPGTHRLYSNPSLGLLGYIAARSLGAPFEDLMEQVLFPKLGLRHTYLRVPPDQVHRYALGHAKDGTPTRMTPGMLASQAYGVKTTAADLLRFVEANLDSADLDETLQRSIAATHIGYHRVAGMTQGLGWEMYDDATDLDACLAGNSAHVIFDANPVVGCEVPPLPRAHTLCNKTGSTNGFAAYVAFVPGQRLGLVMLANKNYPIPARVKAAHQIVTALGG